MMLTIAAVIAALSLGLTLLTHLCVGRVRRGSPASGSLSPVTILKPLCGVDDDLYANLASFARQDYPTYQIVFGAERSDDPALLVAERIRRDFPECDITIVAGAPPLGRNPKVRNLAAMSRSAKHESWLISDSNVRVGSDYLRATAAVHQSDVGVVTNLFAGVGERSVGALFENLQLGTWIASGVAGSQVLAKRACVVGKSMLFRRSLLQRVGGWTRLADILAEDYVMGALAEAEGLRTVVAPHVITTVNRTWSLRLFVNRHLRWAQIRRRLCPAAYLAEPLLYPLPWLLLLATAGAPLAALAGLGLKVASDLTLGASLRGRAFGPSAILAIPCKDLLITAVWLVGAFRRRVNWRGHQLRIGDGTVLSEAPMPRERDPRRRDVLGMARP
jgi:ceramide glucosyltransferase